MRKTINLCIWNDFLQTQLTNQMSVVEGSYLEKYLSVAALISLLAVRVWFNFEMGISNDYIHLGTNKLIN